MTSADSRRFEVQHRADESRYVLIDHEAPAGAMRVAGEELYKDIEADGGVQRILYHTIIAEEYGGQGLASLLVKAVVDDIVDRGYVVVPVCPYVAGWLPRHPEYEQYVVRPTVTHIRAVSS